jgi:hydroxyethylthiazole kinase-like uncharacterized protein yjeF
MPPTSYPPHRAVSAAEARASDRRASEEFGLVSLVLMEHAGRGLACLVRDRLPASGPVVVVCGPGNNGGDGYACARFLASWGVPVRVVRASAPPSEGGDARLEHDLASRDVCIESIEGPIGAASIDRLLSGASVIIDALFGIGLSRPLSSPYPLWVERINACDSLLIAADVPSGIDADTGVPLPVAVRAHVTAAMGMPKRGCFTADGAPYAGEIVEIDIGLPASIHRAFAR